MSRRFEELVRQARKGDLNGLPRTVLALDPGGTTGYAVFKDLELIKAGQCAGTHKNMTTLILFYKPDVVVCEDYVIYPWEVRNHKWSKVPTLRLIGGIESQCQAMNVPLHLELAQQAKAFCTDQKLAQWGFYKPGLKHARDAIRHACYHLLFKYRL